MAEDYPRTALELERRKSASRGKLFYRLAQQAVQLEPTTCQQLIHPNM